MLEAMGCEVSAISFDCPSGPLEISDDGVNGLLVSGEDMAVLVSAMTMLLCDGSRRTPGGKRRWRGRPFRYGKDNDDVE